jgi:hypothetical protein
MMVFVIIATVLLMIPVGYFYIRDAREETGSIMSRCNYSELATKHAYIQANMDKFGCKDSGTSMDDREIYVVSPEAMGLQPKSDWDKPFVAAEE